MIALVSSYDMMLPLSNIQCLTALPLTDSTFMLPMGIAKRVDRKYSTNKQLFFSYAEKYFHGLGTLVDDFWNEYFHLT